MSEDYDINKRIAEYKAKKSQEDYDINKRIEEYKKQKESPISEIFKQYQQKKEEAEFFKDSVMDTPEMAARRKFDPIDMVVGMGMGGVEKYTGPTKSLLQKAIDYVKSKKQNKQPVIEEQALPKELQFEPVYAPDLSKESRIDRIINVNARAKESQQARELKEAEAAAKELQENLKVTNDPIQDIDEITKKIK